jgi:hypothetical protein
MPRKKTWVAKVAANLNDIPLLITPLEKIAFGGFFLFELIRGLVRVWRAL